MQAARILVLPVPPASQRSVKVLMQLRLLKVVIIQIVAAIVIIVGGFFAYVAFATHSAQSKAQILCDSIPMGATASAAGVILSNVDAESHLRFASTEKIGIGFRGAFLDRWFCNIEITKGAVSGYEIHLVD